MISAINSAQSNSISFTSVVPLRVFIDGMETFNPQHLKYATHKLTAALAGPAKNDSKNLKIIREFAKYDPDYKIEYGFNGYPKRKNKKNIQPSDYFRCIFDKAGSFLFTGAQAEKLNELGKSIGTEKVACKSRKINNSFDLQAAKHYYRFVIGNFMRSAKLRIKEGFDPKTKIKTGKPVVMHVNMISNKKYGQSNFKMTLDDINFKPVDA